MGILYMVISLILFILVILIKKSEKKQNILFWIILTTVIMLCYNVFESCIITALKLKSSLLALTIFNFAVAVLIGIKIFKDKAIQKYYIRVKDILAILILLMLVIFIGYKNYGYHLDIKYETTDPAVHYNSARIYYEEQSTPAGDLKTTMPGAYTNTGILFTVFSNYMEEIDLYKIYIIFDITILLLIGTMFYIGIINKEDDIAKSIVALIMSILFVCGYPLNSMIFGYAYLSVGILILVAIISMTQYIKNKEINKITFLSYMFLLMYGIFFSYYFFVPVIYSSLGLYMLFDMIKNRKNKSIFSIFTKENIIDVIVILIIPTILGFCYFVLPGLISSNEIATMYIAIEGYCYRDLYSNFLLFTPFVLYYCISKIKNKENSFLNINFIITSIFIVFLLYMGLKGKASSYYYYKTYFLLSIIVMQITTKTMFELMDNKFKYFVYSFIIIYLGILGCLVLNIENKISEKNYLFNPVPKMNSYVDIYSFNYTKINANAKILNESQIKAIKYLKQKDATKENTEIYGDVLQMLWINGIAKLTESDNIVTLQTPVELNIEKWLEKSNKKYYLCLDANDKIEKESNLYNIIYEDVGVMILEK